MHWLSPRCNASRVRPIQVVSLAVALVLGVWMLFSRATALAGPAPAPARRGAVPSGSASAPAASASAPAASSATPADLSPLDYAVIQTDEDFDPNMSEEQKTSIGTGKVPIHREGPFKSPLAHPRFGGPAHVKVGLVLVSVDDYDIQTGTFNASFYLSLTSDKPMPKMDLQAANAEEMERATVVDTPTFKAYRCNGEFRSAVDLRKYPFDSHSLNIDLEDLFAGVDQVVFEPDPARTALDEGFQVAGWRTASVEGRAYAHRYPPRFDRDDLYVSRYRFALGIERFGTSAAFGVFVPAIVIVLIAVSGMWVPPNEMEVRSNTGAPMLAAAVLFHFALMQQLPATGYLTRADTLMMGVYFSLLINMASTWLLFVVPADRVNKTFRQARVVVPLITAVIMLISIFA